MPISVQYQPPAGTIADAAWLGGYAQYRKYQDQIALQQQEMAEREQAQIRSLLPELLRRCFRPVLMYQRPASSSSWRRDSREEGATCR